MNYFDEFVKEDGIKPYQQLNFSLTSKYFCRAACKICYLGGKWQTPQIVRPSELHYSLLDVFNHIYIMEDLEYLYSENRSIYNWYSDNAGRFLSPSITDTSIFSHYRYIKDLNLKGLSQFAVSASYFKRNKSIISKLTDLVDKFGKFEVGRLIYDVEYEFPPQLLELCEDVRHNSNMLKRGEPKQSDDWLHSKGDRLRFRSDTIFFHGDSFFYDIESSINGIPYFKLDKEFSLKEFLPIAWKHRLKEYKKINSPYCRYIANHVKVNDDYNFIPFFMYDSWKLKHAGSEIVSLGIEIDKGIITDLNIEHPIPLLEMIYEDAKL